MDSVRRLLPIDPVLPRLAEALAQQTCCVLSAPPGAGKTTRVPPFLLKNASWLAGKKIVMLEPRRIAARRAAEFMAAEMGGKVGETVGFRIRNDARVSPETRIEVVTEGILTRMIQSEADLPGIGLVVFDEFHERSIHADLGLALALDVQEQLRQDLRILVMSATLDGLSVARLLGNAPIVESAGRMHRIETRHLRSDSGKSIERRVAETVIRALDADQGDVLVFLPGRREIRRTEELLLEMKPDEGVDVHLLYGDAPPAQQEAALSPAPPGRRKVILSTSVAETSVTIDGVRVVIDSGLARVPRFDPRRGMEGLVTIPVSRAIADQRRGRSGREAPGVCYRLWTEQEHETLPAQPQPEIVAADLAPLAIELARWGDPDAARLRFLDRPPIPHLTEARTLLQSLGAVDHANMLTAHGKQLADFPIHPRIAHMIVRGREIGCGALACELAAILEERDPFGGRKDRDIDLASRWDALRHGHAGDRALFERIRTEASRLRRIAGVGAEDFDEAKIGLLLALAYPDRIGQKREGKGGRYLMAQGTTGQLPERSLLSRERYLAIGEVDGIGSEVRIHLAAPLAEEELIDYFEGSFVREERVEWNETEESITAVAAVRLGAIVIAEKNIGVTDEQAREILMRYVHSHGPGVLRWSADAVSFRQRSEWLRTGRLVKEDWPGLSDEALLLCLERWLLPFLAGRKSRRELEGLNVLEVLQSLFTRDQLLTIDRLAPPSLSVASGSRIALHYEPGKAPVLAVRLQELFGQTDTPRVADGKVPVVVHLLSPAMRPLAVTQDLRSFWAGVYPEIRNQMRARYPKHVWPENPLTATPTRRTRRRS